MGYTIMYSEGYTLACFVLAGILATVFVVSCILSVIKAVRDRRRILARIKARSIVQDGDGTEPSGSCKSRPNIIIIHDAAKEQRLKNGASPDGSDGGDPSAVSSPGDQASRNTETTIAEVSWHQRDDSGDNSPVGKKEDEVLELGMVTDDQNYKGRSRSCEDVSGATAGAFHILRSAVDFNRYIIDDSHQHCRKFHEVLTNGRLREHHDDSLAHSMRPFTSSETNVACYRPVEGGNRDYHTYSFVRGVPSSSSFHGFSKNNHAHIISKGHWKEYTCTKTRSRRNSDTATDINTNIELEDMKALPNVHGQLHGDEPHPSLNQGADNPAYEEADDIEVMVT